MVMSMLKWTMESVWAAVAVVVTTAGGLYTTSYHWGIVNQQIVELQSKSAQTEMHVAKHDDQLTDIKQQNAAMQQSLDDIKDTVHDIQVQVRKPLRDNHN
jgi:peptidoglycan hydrolase CwlO-like protein